MMRRRTTFAKMLHFVMLKPILKFVIHINSYIESVNIMSGVCMLIELNQ